MTEQILIIEDDTALAAGLVRALQTEGRSVKSCGNLREARVVLEKEYPDLLILDINLPDGNGYDFLIQLRNGSPVQGAREKSEIPVILLTANDMETDIVAGLELGADDYITKPFSLAVLRARVNTQLRKGRGRQIQNVRPAEQEIFAAGRYRFDFARMEFYTDGVLTELSKTEQKLLRVLTAHAGVTISRADLVDRVWTDGAEYVDENALSVTIKRLRDKLSAAEAIKTVYGIGYLWVKE